MNLLYDERINSLPPEWVDDTSWSIQDYELQKSLTTIVLDDDPTGTQTIYGLPVLTEWSPETLAAELKNNLPAFYILTNSRSYSLPIARKLNTEIGHNLTLAARKVGCDFIIISRSDSTLRGHFPGEIDALAEVLEIQFDGCLLIPFLISSIITLII